MQGKYISNMKEIQSILEIQRIKRQHSSMEIGKPSTRRWHMRWAVNDG